MDPIHIDNNIDLKPNVVSHHDVAKLVFCTRCDVLSPQLVLCEGCEKSYCKSCFIKRSCLNPDCENKNYKEQDMIQGMVKSLINLITIKCPGCAMIYKYGLLYAHMLNCVQIKKSCPFRHCEYTGLTSEMDKHLLESHSNEFDNVIKNKINNKVKQLEGILI